MLSQIQFQVTLAPLLCPQKLSVLLTTVEFVPLGNFGNFFFFFRKVIPVVQKMPHEANKTIPWISNISRKKTCDHAGKNFSNGSEAELIPKWLLETKKTIEELKMIYQTANAHKALASVGLSETAAYKSEEVCSKTEMWNSQRGLLKFPISLLVYSTAGINTTALLGKPAMTGGTQQCKSQTTLPQTTHSWPCQLHTAKPR